MLECEHVELSYDCSEDDNYNYVRLAKHPNKGANKILFVLDYMPREDLMSGRMLSGETGELFDNLMRLAKTYYKAEAHINDFDWLTVAYPAYRTAGQSQQFRDAAKVEFDTRLAYIITSYKPDIVVTFGPNPFLAINSAFMGRYTDRKGIHFEHFYGVPIDTTISYKSKTHKFKHIPTLSLNSLVNPDNRDAMYMAGYAGRNLVNVLNQRLTYKIPKLKYKIREVKNLKQFDAMMEDLRYAELVAIDTETTNLNRIVNKLLIIQFATSDGCAYILPIGHKDSTWLHTELVYIKKTLKDYFERKNKNKEHLYANAVFDLNRIAVEFGVRFFKNSIFDMFAAEYALDENMKSLVSMTGNNYYSLLNFSMQYGCDAYYTAEFGKDKRTTIEDQPLNDALLEYCALDVILLHHLRNLQMQRAKDIGYKKFHSIVTEQISDMLHTFSRLELVGSKTDIKWLFHLKSKESPLMLHKKRILDAFMETDGVKKTNQLLSSSNGAPKLGLFGATNLKVFSLRKTAHVDTLFFDVLKLKPLSKGANGKGSVDKKFQEQNMHVPEIALYQELQKINRLMNSYVNAFIKQWSSDADMRHDEAIRPYFQFRDVVTGRTSAKKPSLHQIPSRNSVSKYIKEHFPDREDLGKSIKRLFIAKEGHVVVKVDYAAHEVRGWSIISGDAEVAELFWHGLRLRNKFKLRPTEHLNQKIAVEGDVHKINAAYFFSMDIGDVDKPKRDSVKQVIFGLIYQQGLEGVAESTGQTLVAIKDLVKRFFKRFPVGAGWFDKIKKTSIKNLYVESPLGRRRHLWPYLVPKSSRGYKRIFAAAERRAVNSPIQGMGSDFLMSGARVLEKMKFDHYRKTKHYPDFYMTNSVHDSLEFSVAYKDLWLAIRMIEHSLTYGVMEEMTRRHGIEFLVPLEIDFEVGPNIRDCKGWDYSIEHLNELVEKSVDYQLDEMGYTNIDKKAILRNVAKEQYKDMPDWAKKQAWNKKLKMKGMNRDLRGKHEVFNTDDEVNKSAEGD